MYQERLTAVQLVVVREALRDHSQDKPVVMHPDRQKAFVARAKEKEGNRKERKERKEMRTAEVQA